MRLRMAYITSCIKRCGSPSQSSQLKIIPRYSRQLTVKNFWKQSLQLLRRITKITRFFGWKNKTEKPKLPASPDKNLQEQSGEGSKLDKWDSENEGTVFGQTLIICEGKADAAFFRALLDANELEGFQVGFP